jgi:hypothetical protein
MILRCPDEKAFHADIDRFGFDVLPAKLDLHSGFKSDTPGSAFLMLDGAMSGAHEAQETIFIKWLV